MPSITHPAIPCHIPAQSEEVLLGVDTHKDVHAAAVITVLGAVVDRRGFPATADGYRQLIVWARSVGTLRRAGVECTGSYGKALARHLNAEGIEVSEVNQPDKAARRRHGKTDAVDAEAAARAVLSGRATATAKTGDGPAETLRLFKIAKGSAVKTRTQAINQLKSVAGLRRPGAARGPGRAGQPPPDHTLRPARRRPRRRRPPHAAAARPASSI